jgi:peroxiredoxin family protein
MNEEKKKKLSIIVFSGDMDKLMSAYIIATGAAASDMDVTMFFTFWGFRALKKNGKSGAKSIFGKMMGWMERGGLARANPSKYSMGGMGRWMFKKMMGAKRVPPLEEFRKMAIDLGVKFYACEMSMDVMEISRENLIDEVEDIVGVGFMIEQTQESFSTMFI